MSDWGEPVPGFSEVDATAIDNVDTHTHDAVSNVPVTTVDNWQLSPTGYLSGGTNAYGVGSGVWLGWDVDAYKLFLGDAAGNNMTWDGSALAITGSITATSGTIGGWTIAATTLSSGNITLDAGNTKITAGTGNDIVTIDAADGTYRLAIGHATYGSAPFRVSKAGVLTAVSGTIGGWTLGATTIAVTGEIELDSTNKIIWVNDGTFGNEGIQLDFNAGVPRFYVGSGGAGEGFTYDGTNVSWIGNNTSLTAAGTFTASDAVITGAITATSGTIGGWTINATTLSAGNVTIDGTNEKMLFGAASAPLTGIGIFIGKDGADYEFRTGNPAGSYVHWDATTLTINGPVLSSLQAGSEIAIQDWTYSGAFSVTDLDTVAWASGTLTLMNGSTYNITGANTGNMAAFTYIYLDIAVSTTLFQVSGSFTSGTGKILIATAQNGTSEASYLMMGGAGTHNFDGTNIAAASIIAGKLSVAQLSAIAADLGTITAGTITGGTIQTAAGATAGIKMDATSLRGYDAANTIQFQLNPTTGAITSTLGTIGGWSIGADYLRDAANSMGMASTVTAGNDVRFWAGDSFANRAVAPFRVYEDGQIFGTTMIQSYKDEYFQGTSGDGMTVVLDADCAVIRNPMESILRTGAYQTDTCAVLHSNGPAFNSQYGNDSYGFDESTYVAAHINWFTDTTMTDASAWFGIGNRTNLGTPDLPTTSALTDRHIGFFLVDEVLYASNANGTNQTTTDVTQGSTLTQYNSYVIEYIAATSAKFYINGVLVATHTTNLPAGLTDWDYGFAVRTDEQITNERKKMLVANSYQLYMEP